MIMNESERRKEALKIIAEERKNGVTVRQLIAHLQNVDQDLIVKSIDDGIEYYIKLEDVVVRKDRFSFDENDYLYL